MAVILIEKPHKEFAIYIFASCEKSNVKDSNSCTWTIPNNDQYWNFWKYSERFKRLDFTLFPYTSRSVFSIILVLDGRISLLFNYFFIHWFNIYVYSDPYGFESSIQIKANWINQLIINE